MNNTNGFGTTIKNLLLGKSRDPFNPQIFKHIALIAFFAWIGLGADSLSSACYGPQEAFITLGKNTSLSIYIALAVGFTVFIIALGYIRVIKLFPTGGGGYKVASVLIHPYAGLIAGCALIVDYVLTITISVASGVNALFSILPISIGFIQPGIEAIVIGLLLIINLRGIKESIIFLLPIMLGFVITHFALVIFGDISHHRNVVKVISEAAFEAKVLTNSIGLTAVVSLLLHAYSLGAGTYTGLEAVANNVNRLVEPRIRTGKWAMLYLAFALSFLAVGLILGYLSWQIHPLPGKTLNAVLFSNILGNSLVGQFILIITMLFETGILFVAASSGFITGPGILANMAIDNWVPRRFRHLSNRLVMQNGILFFGVAAFLLLLLSKGDIHLLIILYSINVFITFAFAFLGISCYWFSCRHKAKHWLRNFIFTVLGFVIVTSILLVMASVKFGEGGWITLCITAFVIIVCALIKRHYNYLDKRIAAIDSTLPSISNFTNHTNHRITIKPNLPTAIIILTESRGVNINTLQKVIELFPGQFKNFIFLATGLVDIKSFRGKQSLKLMRTKMHERLAYYEAYCQERGFAATCYATFGTDIIKNINDLTEQLSKKFHHVTYFMGKLSYPKNLFTQFLDEDFAEILQKKFVELKKQLVVIPMNVA